MCNSLFGSDSLALPQTFAPSTIVRTELLKAISTVSVDSFLLKVSPMQNAYLLIGLFIPFDVVHTLILHSPLSKRLGLVPLSIVQWTTVFLWSAPIIWLMESSKQSRPN